MGECLDEVGDKGAAYVSGVPPFWGGAKLALAMALLLGTTASCANFSLGDMRTTTWIVKGEGVEDPLGTYGQHETLTVSSPESFKRLKISALACTGSNRAGSSSRRPMEPTKSTTTYFPRFLTPPTGLPLPLPPPPLPLPLPPP